MLGFRNPFSHELTSPYVVSLGDMVQGYVLLVRMSRAMREIAADSIVVGIVICGSAKKTVCPDVASISRYLIF